MAGRSWSNPIPWRSGLERSLAHPTPPPSSVTHGRDHWSAVVLWACCGIWWTPGLHWSSSPPESSSHRPPMAVCGRMRRTCQTVRSWCGEQKLVRGCWAETPRGLPDGQNQSLSSPDWPLPFYGTRKPWGESVLFFLDCSDFQTSQSTQDHVLSKALSSLW